MGSHGNCVELNEKVPKTGAPRPPCLQGVAVPVAPPVSHSGTVPPFHVSTPTDTYCSGNWHCLITELWEFFICFGFTSSEP